MLKKQCKELLSISDGKVYSACGSKEGIVGMDCRERLRKEWPFSYKMQPAGREQLNLSASKFVHAVTWVQLVFNNFLEELC